ncbi:hypothetical protein BFV98_31125 [Micromonospora sp. WMMB235]|nr:hypothetical protein BFV98_31125 [Micromonospora sp. WMMB235]
MVADMDDGRGFGGVGRRVAVPTLLVWAVLVLVVSTARDIGLCIVFRLTRRAVPGCVPAWSADRAPPTWTLTA